MSFYAYASYTGNGATQTFAVPFPYIAKADVVAYVNGVQDLTFTWPTSSTVTLTSIPANGLIVVIKRATPRTANVNFNDASTLTATNLNNNTLQLLYLVQEQLDTASLSMGLALDGTWDGQNRKIANVVDPVSVQQVATKNYVDVQFAATNATVAANATSSAASRVATDADVVLTHADVVLTHADAASTSANAATATTGAATATTQAAIATAASTATVAGLSATSVTSLTLATGAQSLTVQTGKGFIIGMTVNIAETPNPALHLMVGTVTSYNSGTGVLAVSVTQITGTGTYTAWTVSLGGSAASGASGDAGASGTNTLFNSFSSWGN